METRGEPLQNKVLEGRRVFSQTSSLFVAVLHVRDSIREIPNNRSQTRRTLYPEHQYPYSPHSSIYVSFGSNKEILFMNHSS